MNRKSHFPSLLIALAVFLGPLGASGGSSTLVVTNAGDDGPGTLRQAILQGNSDVVSTIRFALPACGCDANLSTIALRSDLPTVGGFVTIDATTQPGWAGTPLVELDGGGTVINGLELNGNFTIVRGLAIRRFARIGVFARSSSLIESNTIFENGYAGIVTLGTPSSSPPEGNPGFEIKRFGIATDSSPPFGNAFRKNSIFTNDVLGIDVGYNGVTTDNLPVLTSVVSHGGTNTTITGTLASDFNPNARFDLEFFSSSVCHTSGFGEGKIYLGELTNVASGNTSFVFTVAPGVAPGRFITATATRRVVVGTHTVEESTSEFSRCLPVPGLTGQWAANLKLSCAYTERLEPYVILRGRFCVTNEGTMSSPPALVRFYLASGPERSAADLYLGRVAVRPLAAQQTRCVRFHGRLPVRAAFADKYVLAVVDANPRSPDNHETDPVFACAVCPDPGPSSR